MSVKTVKPTVIKSTTLHFGAICWRATQLFQQRCSLIGPREEGELKRITHGNRVKRGARKKAKRGDGNYEIFSRDESWGREKKERHLSSVTFYK